MTQAEEISQAIATVERQISEAKSETAKKVLAKKLERLVNDLKKAKPSLTTLPKARKTVKSLNTKAFEELVEKLSKNPEYSFLKNYSQERLLRDKARTAKPKGYRFKGDNDKKPTPAQVKKGLKDGSVYYEGRPIHSDISRDIRLKRGGNAGLNNDSKFEAYKEMLIKTSDSFEKGEGFNSRYLGATNKKGDKTNGEYVIEGQEIIWTYTDKNGKDYTSSEQPELRLTFADGGNIYSDMTEKEFLTKYFGANTFVGNPSEYFDIKNLSSGNDSKVEAFIADLKKEGYSIKKKSYSSFTSVMGVKKKNKMATGGAVSTETIDLKFYNVWGQVVESGKVIIDYDNETITLSSGKTYKVEPNREYTYKFLKTKIKAVNGIKGLAEYLKEISVSDHPSNTRVLTFIDSDDLMYSNHLEEAYKSNGAVINKAFEKNIILGMIDNEWKEHLREMDDLRSAVNNATYEQKDPLVVYKLESYELFKSMLARLNEEAIELLMKLNIPAEQTLQSTNKEDNQSHYDNAMTNNSNATPPPQFRGSDGYRQAIENSMPQQEKKQPIIAEPKVNRNDACPCGSGKKFKQCHGK